MKDFDKIEELLKEKSYQQLNNDERMLIDQELGKELYAELHGSMNTLKSEKLKVSRRVHSELLREFDSEASGVWSNLFTKKVPAYALLLPIVLLISIYFWLPEKQVQVYNDRVVEVVVRDTLQVTRTDTLWREKLVEVEVPKIVYVTTVEPTKEVSAEQPINLSISDQKELMDLVVRGQ